MLARRLLSSAAAAPGASFEQLAAKTSSVAAKAELAKLQGMYAKVQAEAKATAEAPPAIDFAAYKAKVRNTAVLGKVEKALGAVKYPVAVNTSAAKAEAKLNELVGQAKASAEASTKRATELKEFLARLQANRTTVDTTVDDVAKLYPQIEQEIAAETANQQWGKGLGAGV